MASCRTCGRALTNDEIGMTKKMVNRGATEFFCMDCLAAYHRVPVENLYRKLEEFRAMGCTLFAPVGEGPAPGRY